MRESTRRFLFLFVAAAAVFAALPAIADDQYVQFAKSLSAKEYDSTLPEMPFAEWLQTTLPPPLSSQWSAQVTACGEQTGDPFFNRERDLPLCAEVAIKEAQRTVGHLLLFVGTENKGTTPKNAALYYGFITCGNRCLTLRHLGDLCSCKDAGK